MAIGTPTEKAFVNTTSGATSYATTAGAWAPTAGNLYVAFVANTKSSLPDTPTFSGNNVTWYQMATKVNSAATPSGRITAFAAEGTGGSSGESTADFAGLTQNGCSITVLEVPGADATTVSTSPGTGKSIVQAPTAADAGNGTTATATLSAAENSLNRPLAGFMPMVNQAVTFRANWTELSDRTYSSPDSALETQWRSDAFETTATATWGASVRWSCIALEIKTADAASDWSVGFIPIF